MHDESNQVIHVTGWYEDNWFENHLEEENLNCTKEQMKVAAEGHMTTEALMWNKDNEKTISGMVSTRSQMQVLICNIAYSRMKRKKHTTRHSILGIAHYYTTQYRIPYVT